MKKEGIASRSKNTSAQAEFTHALSKNGLFYLPAMDYAHKNLLLCSKFCSDTVLL